VLARCVTLIGLLLMLASAHRGDAQTVFDQNGFGPGRDSYTVLRYEYIDPLSGNPLLTVTDLSLPSISEVRLRARRLDSMGLTIN
jgi:hypothetical protein